MEVSVKQIIPTFILALAIAWLLRFIRRVYFHPLSKFPGPWLAKGTRWYQFHHDIIQGGTYSARIPEFEKQYKSKIIRISPDHLHVNDPDFYHEVFKIGTEYHRAPFFYESLPFPDALPTLANPKKHAANRKLFNPLFSSTSIERIMPSLLENIDQFGELLAREQKSGKPVNIQVLFQLIGINMISEMAFGLSESIIEHEDDLREIAGIFDEFLGQAQLFQHFPLLGALIRVLPDSVVYGLAPGYAKLRQQCEVRIAQVEKRREQGRGLSKFGYQTICDLLLDASPDERTAPPNRVNLVNTSIVFMTAGGGTTVYALSHAVYYVLSHPQVLLRLKEELKESEPYIKKKDWRYIENLPYLGGVVKETLRLRPPVPGFLPKVVPSAGVTVDSQFIPGGTFVSTSVISINSNPEIFDEPEVFRPERWLGEKGKQLKEWEIAFSKGRYNCIGARLANIELQLCLSYLFSRFTLELFETDSTSIEWRDTVSASNLKPIRVSVLEELWEC